ncbi:bifunctional phosphoribosylaminoimidazolecarboxamide formyltransferase/IMP cyclohydrolase [bacterium]
MKVQKALISVSNKKGLDKFAKNLNELGIEIVSTGGTRKFIEKLGIKVKDISDFTGFPEILDGRVKTLHPKVHGALLSNRNNVEHTSQAKEHNIEFLDMVVVNLYPFKEMLKKTNANHEEMIENIDIGGPSMLRSAAKNYEHVVVVCDPNDYDLVSETLKKENDISLDMRASLAAKVFVETSIYDNLIFNYFRKKKGPKVLPLPTEINKKLIKVLDLRYGENPHQKAAYYLDDDDTSSMSWHQLGGKELSYNNLLDIEAAWNMAQDLENTASVIVKHNNPCGVGQDNSLIQAYRKALSTDPMSAFGGIVAFNKKLDKVTAQELIQIFTECVIAPDFETEAIEILKSKSNLRILKINGNVKGNLEYKRFLTGFLVQEKDKGIVRSDKIVTKKQIEPHEKQALEFAWTVCKHVKSNAIVLAKNGVILGIGAGQMSRIDAVELAINKAQKAGFDLTSAVLASDAFFPFKDAIESIASHGITAVIQPGGSIKDQEVIDSCNKNNINMIFTGRRHFRH